MHGSTRRHSVPPRRTASFVALAALLALAACAGAPPREPPPARGASVPEIARALVGVRYRYGGASPREGFDCSGLVWYSHRRAGRSVPRTTRDLYRAARPVPRQALRPGDLVFFRIGGPRVAHVGIYLGGGRFVHAPSTGKRVSITRLDHPYWKPRFLGGGRL